MVLAHRTVAFCVLLISQIVYDVGIMFHFVKNVHRDLELIRMVNVKLVLIRIVRYVELILRHA